MSTALEVCGGRVTDRGLAQIGKLHKLRTLNLSQNARITNAGLLHLSKLHNLTCLSLAHCQVMVMVMVVLSNVCDDGGGS